MLWGATLCMAQLPKAGGWMRLVMPATLLTWITSYVPGWRLPFFDHVCCAIEKINMILLMAEILHHLRCSKPCKEWDKNYQPQLVIAGFLPSTVLCDIEHAPGFVLFRFVSASAGHGETCQLILQHSLEVGINGTFHALLQLLGTASGRWEGNVN